MEPRPPARLVDPRSLGWTTDGCSRWSQALNQVYRATPALWEDDVDPAGFEWIDANDADQSVLSFLRRRPDAGDGDAVACARQPDPRAQLRLPGRPARPGRWRELLNTDAVEWGGSGVGNYGAVDARTVSWHGHPWSAAVTLPPLGVLWLTPG